MQGPEERRLELSALPAAEVRVISWSELRDARALDAALAAGWDVLLIDRAGCRPCCLQNPDECARTKDLMHRLGLEHPYIERTADAADKSAQRMGCHGSSSKAPAQPVQPKTHSRRDLGFSGNNSVI